MGKVLYKDIDELPDLTQEPIHQLDLETKQVKTYKSIDELPDLKKKVGLGSIDYEASSLEAGNKLAQEANNLAVKLGEGKDPITLSLQADELANKKANIGFGMGVKEVPDENSVRESEAISTTLKDEGYDSKGLAAMFKDLPKDVLEKRKTYYNELLNTNPTFLERSVAHDKWRTPVFSTIDKLQKEAIERGELGAADFIGQEKDFLKNLPNEQRSHLDNRTKVKTGIELVRKYSDTPDKSQKDFATEVSIMYGTNLIGNPSSFDNHELKVKYGLTPNQITAYEFIEDTQPEQAQQYKGLFIDPSKVPTDFETQLGREDRLLKLEQIGIGLKNNAILENRDNINQQINKLGGIEYATPELLAEKEKNDADILQLENDKEAIKSGTKYSRLQANDAELFAKEILGKEKGFGEWAIGELGKATSNTVTGVVDFIATPFRSDESNYLRQFELIGQGKLDEEIQGLPQGEQMIKSFTPIIHKELATKIDVIKNNNSLSDKEKNKQVVQLLKDNPTEWEREGIEGGETNVNLKSMLYGTTQLAANLAPFVAISAATGGGGGASALRKFTTEFAAAAATSFNDVYTQAISEGDANPYAKALRVTAINSAAMAGAGSASEIRAMLSKSPSPVIKQLVEKLTDKEIQAVLRTEPKALTSLRKAYNITENIAKKSAQHFGGAAKMVGFTTAGQVVNEAIDGEIKPIEETAKHAAIELLKFGVFGTLTSAFTANKSNPTELNKSVLYDAAKSSESYLKVLEEKLADKTISLEEANQVKTNIEAAKKVLETVPMVDAKGNELPDASKRELLFLKLQEKDIDAVLKSDIPEALADKLGKRIEGIHEKMDKVYKGTYLSEVAQPKKEKPIESKDVPIYKIKGKEVSKEEFEKALNDKDASSILEDAEVTGDEATQQRLRLLGDTKDSENGVPNNAVKGEPEKITTPIELKENKEVEVDGRKAFDIFDADKKVGRLSLEDKGEKYQISNIKVDTPNKGIGTETYRQLISSLDKPLVSDVIRTDAAEAVWRKLEKEGLAKYDENTKQFTSTKEQSLPTQEVKAEQPTVSGKEVGGGVGGDVETKINKVADEYLYHGTGEGAFRRIREEGLTPQGEKYLYFADIEQYAKTYAQRKGNSFGDRVLRVKKSDAYLPDENTTGGDFKIKNKINPNDIEIKHNGKWIPIQEFADENIGIMPISKAVEQSLKETPTPKGNTSNVVEGSVGVGGEKTYADFISNGRLNEISDKFKSKTFDELKTLLADQKDKFDRKVKMGQKDQQLRQVVWDLQELVSAHEKANGHNSNLSQKDTKFATENTPKDDGFDYVRNKFSQEGVGGKRLSDKESNILNKEVDKLIDRAEKENGVKRNELKQATWKTNDGYTVTDFFENGRGGTRIITPKGEEINLFDNKYKGESGRDISYFSKAHEPFKATEQSLKETTKAETPTQEVKTVEKKNTGTEIEPELSGGRKQVTLSGSTEVERQRDIEQRKKETKTTPMTEDRDAILEKVAKFNSLDKVGKRRNIEEVNKLKIAIDNFNKKHNQQHTITRRSNGDLEVKNNPSEKRPSGRAIKYSLKKQENNIVENGKTLTEREEQTQKVFQDLLDNDALPPARDLNGNLFSADAHEATIQDIMDGIPSQRAENYLNRLGEMASKDRFDFGDPNPKAELPTLKDVLGIEVEKGEEMTPEAVEKWLSEEGELTPEQQETFDNIDNLITHYEQEYTNPESGVTPKVQESNAKPTEGSGIKANENEQPKNKVGENKAEIKTNGNEEAKKEKPTTEGLTEITGGNEPKPEQKGSNPKEDVGENIQPQQKDLGIKAREEAAKFRSGEKNILPEWLRAKLPEGTKKSGVDINEVYAKALETFADIHDATKDFAKAIDEAVKHIKKYFDDNKIPYDEGELRTSFEGEVKGKETVRPLNDKALANNLINAKRTPKSAKEGIEKEGLEYEPQSQKEAQELANSIIDEIGIDAAVEKAQANKFGGDVNTLVQTEALNRLAELSEKETDKATQLEHDLKFAEISIALDKSLRKQGQGVSAVKHFYKKSPLGVQLVENASRKKDFDNWAKPKEKSWKEVFTEMMKEPEFEAAITEQVKEGMKQERAEARKNRIKKVDDFFDKAKDEFKGGAAYSMIIPPKVITTALEGMKQAYHAGENVVKLIEDAIDYISNELGGASWDKDKFRNEWNEKLKDPTSKKPLTDEQVKAKILDRFRNKLKGLTDKQKEDVVRKSFQKIVESGGLDYADFRKIIADVTGRGEMTDAEAIKLKELVKLTNSVEDAGKAAREERTPESLKRFRQAEIKAGEAARELNTMLYNRPNITKRLTSVMQLNTLGIAALVNNPIYNVWNQVTLRTPVGFVKTLLDKAIYKGAKMLGKEVLPETNILSRQVQKEFFKKLGFGTKESVSQLFTGLNRQDYIQKEIHGQSIRPTTAWMDLWAFHKGEKHLSKKQVVDKLIQGTVGVPAEVVARILNLGDKPQRFGAEGSQGSAFAKALGLKDMDYNLFIDFPREEAYRVYKERGLSDAEAGKKADYIKDTIIKEGQRSTFQQDNMLNDLLGKVFGGEQSGIGSLAKAVLISPYIKIPSNAYWSYYNLVNPEVAMLQSMIYGTKAAAKHYGLTKKFIGDKDNTTAAKDLNEAKYWFAHAAVGMATRAVVISLVSAGVFRSSNDEENTKKEREGEQNYEQQGTINVSKLMALMQGKNPNDVKNGLVVQNRWFGHWGTVGNTIARKNEDMTPEQKEAQDEFWNVALGGLELEALKDLNQGVFGNTSSFLSGLGEAVKTGEIGKGLESFGVNNINMALNVIHPAALSQVSKAQLPYYTKQKADTFLGEIKNVVLSRSSLIRNLSGQYPPSKIGIWGDKIEKKDNIAMRLFGISRSNDNNFAQPIYEDYKRTNDTRFFPSAVKPEIKSGGETVNLNTKESSELEELVGQQRKMLAAPYMNDMANFEGSSKNYSQLTDEEKLDKLKIIYDLGYENGKELFFQKHPKYKYEKSDEIKKEDKKESRENRQFKKSLLKK